MLPPTRLVSYSLSESDSSESELSDSSLSSDSDESSDVSLSDEVECRVTDWRVLWTAGRGFVLGFTVKMVYDVS